MTYPRNYSTSIEHNDQRSPYYKAGNLTLGLFNIFFVDMEQLKLHYENQLTSLSQKQVEHNNNVENFDNRNLVGRPHDKDTIDIKGDLIGGERANDIQLKEKHKRKKQAAENRMM